MQTPQLKKNNQLLIADVECCGCFQNYKEEFYAFVLTNITSK